MADTSNPKEPAKRQLWLLFVDVNVRVNILLDDASSVQQLSLRYVDDRGQLSEVLAALSDESSNEARPWTVARQPIERRLSTRDRALVEVWRAVGNGAQSIERLQADVSEKFAKCIGAETAKFPECVALFVLARQQLISARADEFLSTLQLAREKLAQILENRPGALPSPLSQRRWANSLYVDFLGSYSLRVRREVAFVAKSLEQNKLLNYQNLDEVERELLDREDSLHGIGYASTSYTTSSFQGDGESVTRQIVTKSSYFYPEQPALLPLLYHEYAHHYSRPTAELSGQLDGFDAFFTQQAYEIAQEQIRQGLLEDVASSRSMSFWEVILDEMKADSIALALGGADYLHALALQIVGQEGSWMSRVAMNDRGDARQDRFVESVDPEPSYENPASYASVLRLFFAIALLRELPRSKNSKRNEFVGDFCASLSEFTMDYLHGLQRLTDGRTQQACARYIRQLVDTVPTFTRLGRTVGTRFGRLLAAGGSFSYGLCVRGPKTTLALNAAVNSYCSTVIDSLFGHPRALPFQFEVPADADGLVRVDSVPLAVRWHIAALIVRESQKTPRLPDEDFRRRICGGFVRYLRNDGSVVFRYLLELLVARRHLFRQVGRHIAGTSTSGPNLEPISDSDVQEIQANLSHELDNNEDLRKRIAHFGGLSSTPKSSTTQIIGIWLTSTLCEEAHATEAGGVANIVPVLIKFDACAIGQRLDRLDSALADSIRASTAGGCCGCDVGMLELGALAPDALDSDARSWQGFSAAIDVLLEQLRHVDKALQSRSATEGLLPPSVKLFGRSTCRTVGEYHYATLLTGTTPVERDVVVGRPLRNLSKPRFVIAISGSLQNALAPDLAKHIGAITLLRLSYRHHWVALKELVQQRIDANATIMMSTAWETAIIVWRSEDTNQFWKSASLLSGAGDSHTLLMVPDFPTPEVQQCDSFERLAEQTGDPIEKPNFRTGRYDVAKVFNQLTVQELAARIDSIKGIAWREIEKISIEARIPVAFQSTTDALCRMPQSAPSGSRSFDWMLRKMDRKS